MAWIGLYARKICQFMSNNRMTYLQHYGTNIRESESMKAAEREPDRGANIE